MAVHGALIEYSGQFIGPGPNIVVFQFNPEQLARTIRITPNASEPDRAQRAQSERTAAAGPPVEEVTVKLSLSAAEDLGTEGPFSGVTRAFGIGLRVAEVPASDDLIAQGALLYTRTVKEARAIAQMARGIASLPDILPI